MAGGLKKTSKFSGWRRVFWVFVKAQLSSYVASFSDFLATILLAKLCGLFYLYATFLGSVVGGLVNCAINYRWVFRANECKKVHVALKYLFVWGGSILLNTCNLCLDRVAHCHALGGRTVGTLCERCIYLFQNNCGCAGGVLLELSVTACVCLPQS